MKKKAAIFTWCYDNGPVNYGQILQCYAMQKLCEEYGMDVIIVKYRHLKEFEKSLDIPPKGIERDNYESHFKDEFVEKQVEKQVEQFKKFISENINLSPQCYSVKDIEEEISDRELLIVGSDQLWNPLWFDPVYLLEFAKAEQRCVSIATGGICANRERYRPVLKKIAKGIERFDYVSVREVVSKDILKSYTDKQVVDCLDPTLLIDKNKWKKLCNRRVIDKKYIFVYCLGKLSPHKHVLKEIIKKYNAKKIFYIKMHYSSESINGEGILEPIVNAGPKEFLSLIRYAEAVCTDSFHGFIFALIFKKNFYLVDRAYIEEDKISNTRMDNLMDKLRIKKRYTNSKKELSEIENIDYESVEKELEMNKKLSIKEFERAIEML